MIKELNIENFKSHLKTDLELSNLNLFTGANGVGKSSIIQALLLLRQSYQKSVLSEGIDLNKPLCYIGTVKDALNENAESPYIKLNIKTKENNFEWLTKEIEEKDFLSTLLKFPTIPEPKSDIVATEHPKLSNMVKQAMLSDISLFNDNFQYLSAARLAPQEYYDRDDHTVSYKKQISLEKGQAELVAHFLDTYGKEDIEFENLLHPNQKETSLISQTTAWEKEISANVNVVVNRVGKNFEIKYNFDTDGGLTTGDFKAENVGFGLTYALPIIVAILSAKKGSILIIENPEAHLHPYAQSKIAELMALAAMNDMQLWVETHSDHIINGVLVAIKNFEKNGRGVAHDRVKMFFVERDEKLHASKVIDIPVLEGGRLKNTPQGFFDQISKDRKFLMGF